MRSALPRTEINCRDGVSCVVRTTGTDVYPIKNATAARRARQRQTGASRQNGLSLSADRHLYDAALAKSNANLSGLYPAMQYALILFCEITLKTATRQLFMRLFGIRFFVKRLHSRLRDSSDSTVWHSVFTQRTFRT